MDTVDLLAQNNDSFVFSRILTPWADLYDLDAGTFRAQMRKSADDHVVFYEWSSADGRIALATTAANGTVSFTLNPTNGKTLTLGQTVVTLVTPSTDHPLGNEVAIGINLGATLINLLAFLHASIDIDIAQCSYDVAGTDLAIVFKTNGTLGNLFQLATNVTGATASGETLSGANAELTMSAPWEDLRLFVGEYVYDCRFELGADVRVSLFGGTITWNEGVTRG